jgi:periplasmic protein TonB
MALPLLILSAARAKRAAPAPVLAGRYGYQAESGHRALSASFAVLIAGGVGATLMLALVIPEMAPRPDDDGLTVWRVPPVEQPKVEPDPAPKTEQQADPADASITTTPRQLPPLDGRSGPEVTPLDPPTKFPPEGGAGENTGPGPAPIVEILPPVLEPVWRNASRSRRHIGDFQPPYPASRQREGMEGNCQVSVTIAPSGRVTAVRAQSCADEAFFRATERQALRNWRFEPATRDGVAVESTLTQNVVFRIND